MCLSGYSGVHIRAIEKKSLVTAKSLAVVREIMSLGSFFPARSGQTEKRTEETGEKDHI